jgi:AraC-like DNA-binding protein
MEVLDQDVVHLENTPLRVRRVVVRLPASVAIFQSTNRRLRTRTRLQDGLMAFSALGPRASGSLDGLALRPDLLLVAEPGAEAEFVVEPGYNSITVLMSPKDLEEHLRARQRRDDFEFPCGVELRHASELAVRSFYELGRRIADSAAHQPAVFNDSEQSRAMAEVDLVETLLAILGSGSSLELTRRDRTRQGYTQIIKAVEAHVLAHVGERLYVTDMCKAAGVSERTLQYAFREILGMAPIAYLRRLRLHRVHEALRTATYGSTTVSTEALNWGFWHFGEFSRAYKVCFGELPSETLKRSRG